MLTECEGEPVENLFTKKELNLQKMEEQRATKRDSNMWYLDNGASNYMIGHHSIFLDLDKGVRGKVILGDGSLVNIK